MVDLCLKSFLTEGAPLELNVNIDYYRPKIEEAKKSFYTIEPDLLDDLQNAVEMNMCDTFSRFVEVPQFKKFKLELALAKDSNKRLSPLMDIKEEPLSPVSQFV